MALIHRSRSLWPSKLRSTTFRSPGFFLLSALLSLLACFLKHQLSVLCLPGFFQYPPRLSSDDDAESRMVLTF